MNKIRFIVRKMFPSNTDLSSILASEIVENICARIYQEETYLLRDKEVLDSIPQVIRDCVLLIDLDTEINMNGIIGYLENSTGKFMDETIEVLERIGAVSDAITLNNIKKSLAEYGLKTSNLHANVQNLKEYQISNNSQTHGNIDSELLKRIEQLATNLYIYNQEENIFDDLYDYIEANKQHLINELKEFCK
ncbi:DMP19 family protein [Paenibacillus sp. KQZ6P-2]|uniref:DMP19 family protein n=1 Tax=Paenibacillus mangrovi TaxID=2931978 RepID=A0A9X1WKN8_9BACL|nr:DUF4375 domain-containing protein [Paenibacillus mangrovi]MCJ8010748.1 DMP19 family protein [Paenibacillus mangrovi]